MKIINESVKDIVNSEGYGISPQRITEAALARVIRWIAGTPTPQTEKGVDADAGFLADAHQRFKVGGHFAILTSWRKFDKTEPATKAADDRLKGDDSEQQANAKNFRSLINQIEGVGLGCIRLTGSWLEAGGGGDKPFERSLFIPGKDKHGNTGEESVLKLPLIKSLGIKYNQDAIIYAGPETDGKVELWSVDRDYAANNNGKLRYKPSPDMVWRNAGLRSAGEIEKNLNRAKDIIARGEQGATEDDPPYFNVGASQVGGSSNKPTLQKGPGIRFEQVYEAVGHETSTLGVRWLYDQQISEVRHRITTLLNHDTLALPIHREWHRGVREAFEY